jgi:hypothetical protein
MFDKLKSYKMKEHLKTLFLGLFIFISNHFLVAQTKDDFFEKQVVVADVNFDNIKDVIQVYQDSINPKAIYRLKISLAEIDGIGKTKIVETQKAIKPDFPDAETIDDRFWTGEMFDKIVVENGIISLRVELQSGYYLHDYKFQNGAFELINFKKVNGSPDYLEMIEFNLVTGDLITTTEEGESKPIVKKEINKILPLPKLGEFTPLENELY